MQVVRPNNLMLTPVGIGVAGPSRIVSRSPLPPSLVHLVTQPPPGLAVIPAVSSVSIPAALEPPVSSAPQQLSIAEAVGGNITHTQTFSVAGE